jgi:alpha-L-rhamnosidase
VKPPHENEKENLIQPSSKLPLAFRGLEPRFDSAGLCSPYSAAFAVEACFTQDDGLGAVDLLHRVWGPMIDETHPNFSGGLWEAMTADGEPMHKNTSLMHAWSSSPVYLLPMYLAGSRPTRPGWKEWEAKPVYAGLDEVEAKVDTPAGLLQIRWDFRTDKFTPRHSYLSRLRYFFSPVLRFNRGLSKETKKQIDSCAVSTYRGKLSAILF